MTIKSYKWTVFGIASVALCGWLVHVSLIHAAFVQQLTDKTKVREAQLQTISTWEELDKEVRSAREREDRERLNLKYALMFHCEQGISKDVVKSSDLPDTSHSIFTKSTGIGNGSFWQTDEESEVIAYIRTLTAEEAEKRPVTQLKRTLESPDSRIILPVNSHGLTEYKFETLGAAGERKFGCRLIDVDGTRFVPFCGVANSDGSGDRRGADGPYDDGVFKNREFRVTYGWPDLSELGFVKALQKRGIWLIGSNETYWLDQAKVLHVVVVFASKREWRVHPDYSYSRALDSGFDLEWDPQQENYIASPISR
jgi:hypothetical protein